MSRLIHIKIQIRIMNKLVRQFCKPSLNMQGSQALWTMLFYDMKGSSIIFICPFRREISITTNNINGTVTRETICNITYIRLHGIKRYLLIITDFGCPGVRNIIAPQ
ncbi:hypothetical protein D3C77_562340 [compost metagenome]